MFINVVTQATTKIFFNNIKVLHLYHDSNNFDN